MRGLGKIGKLGRMEGNPIIVRGVGVNGVNVSLGKIGGLGGLGPCANAMPKKVKIKLFWGLRYPLAMVK